MTDARVVEYIKKSLAAGVSEGQITVSLKQQGWNDVEIFEAMDEARAGAPTEKPEPQKQIQTQPKPSQMQAQPKQQAEKVSLSERFHIRGRPVPAKMILVLVVAAMILIAAAAIFLFQGLPLGGGDCGNSMDCLIAASRSCSPATMNYYTATSTFSTIIHSEIFLEIKGREMDGCVLFLRIENIDIEISGELKETMMTSGATREQVAEQEEQMNLFLDGFEGRQGTCTFANNADLASALAGMPGGSILISYEMREDGLVPVGKTISGAVCDWEF